MTIVVLLVGIVLIFGAMLYLTLAVNEFEGKTKELSAILEKRYTLAVPQKKKPGEKSPGGPGGGPGGPPGALAPRTQAKI